MCQFVSKSGKVSGRALDRLTHELYGYTGFLKTLFFPTLLTNAMIIYRVERLVCRITSVRQEQ